MNHNTNCNSGSCTPGCDCRPNQSRDEFVVNLEPVMTEVAPDFRFTDSQGNWLRVKSIETTRHGQVTGINIDSDDPEVCHLMIEDVQMTTDFLHVPGVGFLPPGVVVRYRGDHYLLLFGWHTNVSNQTIYSWFLAPTGNSEKPQDPIDKLRNTPVNKTVYREMIDEIDLIHFW